MPWNMLKHTYVCYMLFIKIVRKQKHTICPKNWSKCTYPLAGKKLLDWSFLILWPNGAGCKFLPLPVSWSYYDHG
jgi:hypothetical protein